MFSKCFYRSCTSNEMFVAFRSKKAGTLIKTAFYVSRRSFFLLEKRKNPQISKFLVYTAKKKFAKKIRQTCQKCTQIVNSNILRKTKFFWSFCFSLYGILSVVFLPYAKTNSARLSKLILKCPLEKFRKKGVFSNFSKFFIVLVLWAKISRPFDGKNKKGLSSQPFTCGEHQFEWKKEKSTKN